MYGLKLNLSKTNDLYQTWEVTDDPEDMLLPDSQFVTAESVAAAVETLKQRFPSPDGEKEYFRVWESGSSITTSTYPTFYEGSRYRLTDGYYQRLMTAAQTYGKVTLAPEDLVRLKYSYYSAERGPSSRSGQIRGLSGYRAGPLVASYDKTSGAYYLKVDPKASGRRKKIDSNKVTKREIEAKKQQEVYAKQKLVEKWREALGKASTTLIEVVCPALGWAGLMTERYAWYRSRSVQGESVDVLTIFFNLTEVVDRMLRKKGVWKTNTAVVAMLDAYTAAAHLIGQEGEGGVDNLGDYPGEGKQFAASLNKLRSLAKSLAADRRRKTRAAAAAPEEAPATVAGA